MALLLALWFTCHLFCLHVAEKSEGLMDDEKRGFNTDVVIGR